jgi:hypothetical protein
MVLYYTRRQAALNGMGTRSWIYRCVVYEYPEYGEGGQGARRGWTRVMVMARNKSNLVYKERSNRTDGSFEINESCEQLEARQARLLCLSLSTAHTIGM